MTFEVSFGTDLTYCSRSQCIRILSFLNFFTLYNSSTRGHQMKLMKRFSHVNNRAVCLSNRCIDARNSPSNDIIHVSSVCAFKNRLKKVYFYMLINED